MKSAVTPRSSVLSPDTAGRMEELLAREQALAQVSLGVLISDADGILIYANSGFERTTGYPFAEVIGRNCRFLQGPDTDPETVARLSDAVHGGKPFEGEILNYRRDGTPFWNELTLTPVRDAAGTLVRFIAIQRDVTERKRTIESLAEQASILRMAGQIAQFGGWVILLPERRPVLSDAVCAMHDLPPGTEVTVEDALLFFLPEWREIVASGVDACIRDGTPFDIEAEMLTARGRQIWIRTTGMAERDDRGVIRRIFGAFQDITERRLAEEQRRLATERLEVAAKAGKVGIWEFDHQTGGLTWDDQMYLLYGMDRTSDGEGVARWKSRLHPEDRERAEAELAEALKPDGRSFDTEFRIVRENDGAIRYLRAIATAVRRDDGQPWRMVGTNWDVTNERKRERDLAAALDRQKELTRAALVGEQAKSQFLAVMSHEIRTPMNGILGFAELLSRDTTLSAENKGYLQTITSSGEALLRILDDILDFSRIDAGRMTIEKISCSPGALAEELGVLFRPQITTKGLSFDIVVEPDVPPQILADSGRIRQILVNLLGNAFKFTAEGGIRLTVRVKGGVPELEFEVRDSGEGITEEQIQVIFEPFTQADSTIARRHGGTGLGLAISRRLAQLMGGTLEVESSVHVGTAFILRLPLEISGEIPAAVVQPTAREIEKAFAQQHPMRLLLVEDDAVNLKLLVTIIRKLGYEPFTARNGADAVALVAREHPDCILMDVQMPGMDGISAARMIRNAEETNGAHPVFICALTADIMPEDRSRCIEAGMNEYLNKPVRSREILRVLGDAHRHRKSVNPAPARP